MAQFVKTSRIDIRINPDVIREVNARGGVALTRLAQEAVVEAQKRSPYQTGTNRRSITHRAVGGGRIIFTTSGYGGYLEVGTGRMAARPYIRPAIEAVAQTVGQGGQAPTQTFFEPR